MSEHQEPSELKKAEPWLRTKAERITTKMFPGDWVDDQDDALVDWVLLQLKVAYSEGYADRMKTEVAETKSEVLPPKRRPRKK